jgi:hypothetical protein
MKRLVMLIAALMFVASGVFPQGQQEHAKRDIGKEDSVASLFEKARLQAGGGRLRRIKYRKELEAKVCDATVRNKAKGPDDRYPASRFVLYRTAAPDQLNSEIERIASYDKGNKGSSRYAVAVWERESLLDHSQYWVIGISQYPDSFAEFIENHLTDAALYHNQWKDYVAAECRKG